MSSVIQIQFYGLLADLTGTTNTNCSIIEGETVEKLMTSLKEAYPELTEVTFRIAINHEMADTYTPIHSGDQVALLPPFAGG